MRRSRTKPKEYTENEKLARLTWALNNQNNNFMNACFADESTKQTRRYGLYHMRRKSKRPNASSCKPRDVDSVHVWAAISWFGATKPVVSF